MPTARELLEQAEALMRRNRAGAIDTEIPELTDVVPAVVAPPASPASLDDVPELTDVVEEIEIASIAELPDDSGAQSEWLRVDRDARTLAGVPSDSVALMTPPVAAREAELPLVEAETATVEAETATVVAETATVVAETATVVAETATVEPESATVEGETATVEAESATVDAETRDEAIATVALEEPLEQEAPTAESDKAPVEHASRQEAPTAESAAPVDDSFEEETPTSEGAAAPVVSPPEREAVRGEGAEAESAPLPVEAPAADGAAMPVQAESTVAHDDWARWQALAEEIRMQVLQRIDIFTDTALRERLGAQLQPIVDRASAEMIETINREVGTLLRAYIAEAIEREIEKWRKGNT